MSNMTVWTKTARKCVKKSWRRLVRHVAKQEYIRMDFERTGSGRSWKLMTGW